MIQGRHHESKPAGKSKLLVTFKLFVLQTFTLHFWKWQLNYYDVHSVMICLFYKYFELILRKRKKPMHEQTAHKDTFP